MVNRVAEAVVLVDGDRDRLEQLIRASTTPVGIARRARICVLSSDGIAKARVAEVVGVSRPTVDKWLNRYRDRGIDGLVDEDRSGRPPVIDEAAIVVATLTPPPKRLGVTHWSARLLAPRVGVDHTTVSRVWRRYKIAPWRSETFKFSRDPDLEAKVVDVVGLYMNPPENAVVLSIDEKSQIQALDRTQPMLPMQPGHCEQRTHDYVRHGTTTLFAALNIATGQVATQCKPRHRHQEFLAFLKHVAKAYPDQDLHMVMDNYGTHKKAEVTTWLAANPRITVHFTPTSGSWLNMVESWFAIIERQAIHRGTFTSVTDLTATIRRFVTTWNTRSTPFVWTKPADEILTKLKRKQSSATNH